MSSHNISDVEEKSTDAPAPAGESETIMEKVRTNRSRRSRDAEPRLDQITKSPTPSERVQAGLGASETDFKSDWRFIIAFLSLTTITIMVALDATSISVALPIMAQSLGGSSIEAFWTGTSFLLTSTVFQPPLGSLSNIFGRKPVIFTSLALFGVGAIVAAVANDFTTVLVGRSIQGIGGGGVIIITEIIVTDMVPLRVRGQWFSFISSAWAIGTVTGPLLGGGFSENVSWRWIFWINLPFIGIGTLLIVFFLKLAFRTSTFADKLRRVDWIGTVLFISSLTGFLIPLTWGGVMYDWSSWRTLFPLILCAFGLVAFVVWEEYLERRGDEPMIRLSVLKTRTSAVTYFGTFIHGLILWCLLYYAPFYFEAIKGESPLLAGVSLFPQSFTVAPASIVVGVVSAITGRYRWATWSGWVITTLGMGLLLLWDLNTSTVAWIFIGMVGGLGTGILFSAMALAVQAASTNSNMAYAVILFAFFRALGQSVGVAIGGVVFQNAMKNKLLTYPLLAGNATQYATDASGLVTVLAQMPAGQEKTELLESYMYGLKGIYYMSLALAILAGIASIWTEGLPLDRPFETEQGFQHRDKEGDVESKKSSEAPDAQI